MIARMGGWVPPVTSQVLGNSEYGLSVEIGYVEHPAKYFLTTCEEKTSAGGGFYRIASLRRYDPDQVMRVERFTLLSACYPGSPFIRYYSDNYCTIFSPLFACDFHSNEMDGCFIN